MILRGIVLSLGIFVCSTAQGSLIKSNLMFYLWTGKEDTASFFRNKERIGTILPFFYVVNGKGDLSGVPDPQILEVARKHKIKVMPVLWNLGFKSETVPELLASPTAIKRFQAAVLKECQQHGFWGVQFDFEGMPASIKDNYSKFVASTADLLHANGFKLSVAVVPTESPSEGESRYRQWHAENWRNVYDLKSLATSADFITLMAYDQHTRLTPPGPIGALPWMKKIIDFALTQAPKEKLSLGVALYGRRWIPMSPATAGPTDSWPLLSYTEAIELARQHKTVVQRDAKESGPWFSFYRDDIREYVFFADKKCFRDRVKLAEAAGIPSLSLFVLGKEDPAIWDLIPSSGVKSP